MASTYVSLFYHVIFSTKFRDRLLLSEWREELYSYLGGTIKGLGGVPEQIGGVEDHIHILISLKPAICLSDFMREIKKSSSTWIRENKCPVFHWQEGYAAFTVDCQGRENIRKYIRGQEEHHKVTTFRDELIRLLDQAGVTYDARYLD